MQAPSPACGANTSHHTHGPIQTRLPWSTSRNQRQDRSAFTDQDATAVTTFATAQGPMVVIAIQPVLSPPHVLHLRRHGRHPTEQTPTRRQLSAVDVRVGGWIGHRSSSLSSRASSLPGSRSQRERFDGLVLYRVRSPQPSVPRPRGQTWLTPRSVGLVQGAPGTFSRFPMTPAPS